MEKYSSNKIIALRTHATDFTKWNSTVIMVDEQIKQGEKIKLVSKLEPKRTFNFTVLQLTPTTMVWQDEFAPLFSGFRRFSLTTNSDGTIVFSMVEVFKGVMLSMIKGSLPESNPTLHNMF